VTGEMNTEEFMGVVDATINQSDQLDSILRKTLRVLNEKGIQVLVDFPGMTQSLKGNLQTLRGRVNRVSRELSQLHELVNTSALITSSLELDKVLEEVIDTVVKLTGAERAYLMVKPSESDDLQIRAARNWERETLSKGDITFSQGIVKTAIESRSPLIATNAQEDERFQGMRSVIINELRSVIVVPLMLKEEVIGVLYADNRIEQAVFSQDFVPILTAFANQAAIAISNARAFQKVAKDLQQTRQELQQLKIEIDQQRLKERVSEITEDEFFLDLQKRAKELRAKQSHR
jgi:GAF domain-containing protein